MVARDQCERKKRRMKGISSRRERVSGSFTADTPLSTARINYNVICRDTIRDCAEGPRSPGPQLMTAVAAFSQRREPKMIRSTRLICIQSNKRRAGASAEERTTHHF